MPSTAATTAFSRLETPSNTTTKTIKSFLDEFKETLCILTPSYQRAPCWRQRQNCGLINSVMRNWPIPLITLYKLHVANPDDAADYARGIRYEVVDGQNRIRALRAFMNGTPIRNDKGVEEPVTWEGTDGRAPGAGHHLASLPEEQQEWFSTFELAITVIRHPMTLAERKAMFTRLQDGTPISRAEYAKNTEHPVSQFVSRSGLRESVLGKDDNPGLSRHLAAAKSQWMDLLVDCTTLWINRTAASPLDTLVRDQSALRKVLEGKVAATTGSVYDMPFTDADDAECLAVFDTLFTTLATAHADKVKYHKFHVVLLFHYLCTGETAPSPAVLRAWFKSTLVGIKKDHDRGATDAAIRDGLLFELYAAVRDEATGISSDSPKRRAIPKKKRNDLWRSYFGPEGSGTCQCCAAPILFTAWDQAHITAVAEGGSNELSNLVPTCASCNRSCGTENLRDWCEREYPRAPFLGSAGASAAASVVSSID